MQMAVDERFPAGLKKIVIDTSPFDLINSKVTKPIFFKAMSMIPAGKARR